MISCARKVSSKCLLSTPVPSLLQTFNVIVSSGTSPAAHFDPAAKGLAEGDTCNITVTGGQTEAGTYTAQAAAIDNANYKLPAETTVTFVIRKADFELTGMPQAKTDLVYDGKEQELIWKQRSRREGAAE